VGKKGGQKEVKKEWGKKNRGGKVNGNLNQRKGLWVRSRMGAEKEAVGKKSLNEHPGG